MSVLILPFTEFHAPNVRYRQEQIEKLRGHTGIVEVLGLNRSEDGTFGALRVVFANDEVMQKYLEAGMAALR